MRRSIIPVYILLLLSIAMLLPACLKLIQPIRPPSPQQFEGPQKTPIEFGDVKTFRDGYAEMKRIDDRYSTSFSKERLGKFVVSLDDILPMEDDLMTLAKQVSGKSYIDFEALAHEVDRSSVKDEKGLVLVFIAARIEMLESERYFQLGYKDGNAGMVGDGFFCSERPVIFEAVENFNNSIKHGLNSTYYIDILLTGTKDITHDLVGVNEKRAEFYKAPFQDLASQLQRNINLVTRGCANQTGKDTYVEVN